MSEQKLTNREGRDIREYLWEMQQIAELTELTLALSCSDEAVQAHKAMFARVKPPS